ncbi:MAG: hypothetical protein FWE94_07295 [Coriobacteriia bacterium]|nr:hypothetical protein [Coriobacteriia bacterium]
MLLPIDIRDLVATSMKYRAEREKPVRIAVLIDVEAPQDVIDAAKAAFRPQSGNARLHIEVVTPGDEIEVDASADVVIGLAGPGDTLASSLRCARVRAIPSVVLAFGIERMPIAERLSQPILDIVAERDADALIASLGRWLVERVSSKRVALAVNFLFMRKAVAVDAVRSTAFQNAVIGGVAIIPGADMPIMTANQAKMVIQIAGAYGQSLGAERIKELATVVAGGFALRAVARQALVLVPGFGWAVKAAIGYSGTLAMGHAAIEFFEAGGDVRGLAARLKAARSKAAATLAKRRGDDREVIDAHGWAVVDPEIAFGEPALPPAAPAPVGAAPAQSTGDRSAGN